MQGIVGQAWATYMCYYQYNATLIIRTMLLYNDLDFVCSNC